MISFQDIPDAEINRIQASTLIVVVEHDVMILEHAREMHH